LSIGEEKGSGIEAEGIRNSPEQEDRVDDDKDLVSSVSVLKDIAK
jgi:hypothetical protein